MRKPKWLILILTGLVLFSGCMQRNPEDTAEEEIVEEKRDLDSLVTGNFYVHHGDEYIPLCLGSTNFDTTPGTVSASNETRVMWFTEDWDLIPTLYDGDELVYYDTAPFEEPVYFERFEDFGYTFGICNLSVTETGRYVVNASEGTRQLSTTSDAVKLMRLANKITLDAIGTTPLRDNAISRAGTILGLQKDMIYDVDAYVGTVLKETQIKADSRALLSMEGYTVTDYEFQKEKTIKINIPEYFNTGYYFVEGRGIFRLVRGSSYTEETDFNLPNLTVTTPEGEEQEAVSALASEDKISVYKDGMYVITLTYDDKLDTEVTGEVPEPSAALEAGDGTLPFQLMEPGTLTLTANLNVGEYSLVFEDLYGRGFQINIAADPSAQEASDATEETAVQDAGV